MKNEDKVFAAGLLVLAVILSMGVASMINAGTIRLHLDIFEWTHNKTSLDIKIQEEIEEKENEIMQELKIGVVFLGGGMIALFYIIYKYTKKLKK